jgi:hypothetical protein
MTIDRITNELRRDDLSVLESDNVEVLEVLDSPWRRGEYDTTDVVLVSVGGGAPFVALEETDDIDWDGGAVHRYVPLMAGPVQRVTVAVAMPADEEDDERPCCGSACARCTGERGWL